MYNLDKFLAQASSLKLDSCTEIDVQMFNMFLVKLSAQRIRKITLINCPKIGKQGLLLLIGQVQSHYVSLEKLALSHMNLGAVQIEQIFLTASQLRKLRIG
jgi:hypothetical protein